ncbi:MAG: acyltransferase [Proteobacteria bacterium]|nr:acyltransferase [Pseudomonadota bacterium]
MDYTCAPAIAVVEVTAPAIRELPELTGLRGLAAIWVLLFHAWAVCGEPSLGGYGLAAPFALGWAGVDVFFVLSAFLLGMPFAAWRLGLAPRPALPRYFARRVLRIFPAYYAQLGILLALAAAFGIGRMLDLHDFLAHLGLWLLIGEHPVMPLNGVWFTLPIEFAFYLVLPLLAVLLAPRRWQWLLLACVLLAFAYRWQAYFGVAAAPIPVRVNVIERFPGRIDQFVVGMVASYFYIAWRGHGMPARWSADCLLWLGLLIFAALCAAIYGVRATYWDGHPLLFCWHLLASLALACVLLGCALGSRAGGWLFGNRGVRYLGEISFGVYLWHFPILIWIEPMFASITSPGTRLALVVPVLTGLTVAAAHLSYVLIERPFLRIGRPRQAHPSLVSELPAAPSQPT